MRRAAKVDRNQQEIVSALRQAGCLCLLLHTVGHGCPDLLVYSHGTLYLLEIKVLGGRLTSEELLFAVNWPVCVVWSASDALAAVGASATEVQA